MGWLHDALIPVGAVNNTDTGRMDANYASVNLMISGTNYASATLPTTQDEAWFHFVVEPEDAPQLAWDSNWFYIIDDSAINIVIADCQDGTTTFKWTDGTTTTSLGHTHRCEDDKREVWDVRVLLHATTGRVQIYKDDFLWSDSGDMDTIGVATGRKIETFEARSHASGVSGHMFHWSEFFVGLGAEPTLGLRLWSKEFDAAGTHTAWTGTYTDIDDGYVTDANVISTGSGAQRETFTFPAMPTTDISSNAIVDVAVSSLGLVNGGPSDYEHSLYVNSINYDGGALSVGVTQEWNQTNWATDPNTGVQWTKAGFEAAEAGVESIT